MAHAGTLRYAAQRAYYADLQTIILKLEPDKRDTKLAKIKDGQTVFDILALNPDSEEKHIFMQWLHSVLTIEVIEPPAPIPRLPEACESTKTPSIEEALDLITSEILKRGHYKQLLAPDLKQIYAVANFAQLKYNLGDKNAECFNLCQTENNSLDVVYFKKENDPLSLFIIDNNSFLGGGEQGIIRQALNLQALRSYKTKTAVKICDVSDATRSKDSKNECEILAHLKRFQGSSIIDNKLYIFMDHYCGISLPDLPKNLPDVIRNSIAVQILAAVRSLHLSVSDSYPHGIIHRDIKPRNFVAEIKNGWVQVVIIDFGSSRDLSKESDESLCVIGTPAYLAPEALNQKIHNEKTDCYSAGLVMALALMNDGFNRFENFQINLKPIFEAPLYFDIYKACPESLPTWSEWEDMETNNPCKHRILKFAQRLIQEKPEHRPDLLEIDQLIASLANSKSGIRRWNKFMFLIEIPSRQSEDSTRSFSRSGSKTLISSPKYGSRSSSSSPALSPKASPTENLGRSRQK